MYFMITRYAKNGDLRDYINKLFSKLTWDDKIDMGRCKKIDILSKKEMIYTKTNTIRPKQGGLKKKYILKWLQINIFY